MDKADVYTRCEIERTWNAV